MRVLALLCEIFSPSSMPTFSFSYEPLYIQVHVNIHTVFELIAFTLLYCVLRLRMYKSHTFHPFGHFSCSSPVTILFGFIIKQSPEILKYSRNICS